MGITARVAILLVAASGLTTMAFSRRHEVNADRAELPPCPRSGYYLRALELSKQASVEITASRLEPANRLLKQAITVLGTNYDPYVRLLDDSGQHLVVAEFMEREGKLADTLDERQSVLRDRLSAQIDPMLCNKVITRTAWW